MRVTYEVLGVKIDATSLSDASKKIRGWAADQHARMVFIRDVHGIMLCQNNDALMRLHENAAMVTPDGMPLVFLGRLAGASVERTCGPDLMWEMLTDPAPGLKHFLLGGKAGVGERLAARFTAENPALDVVGIVSPPFRDLSDAEIVDMAAAINRSGADVVWVGLSTPKQELLMARLVGHVHCTMIGVGAAYDFHIGAIKRAPRWMQRTGLEWIFRFAQEPRRLWRRYMVLAPQFVLLVVADLIAKKRQVKTV